MRTQSKGLQYIFLTANAYRFLLRCPVFYLGARKTASLVEGRHSLELLQIISSMSPSCSTWKACVAGILQCELHVKVYGVICKGLRYTLAAAHTNSSSTELIPRLSLWMKVAIGWNVGITGEGLHYIFLTANAYRFYLGARKTASLEEGRHSLELLQIITWMSPF